MSKWQSTGLTNLLPEAMQELISATQSVTGPAATALEAAGAGLSVASAFLAGMPAFDLISATVLVLRQLQNDLDATGIKYLPLWDLPVLDVRMKDSTGKRLFETDPTVRSSFELFLRKIAVSLADRGDPDRPKATGSVAGLVFVTGFPTVSSFIDVFNEIMKILPNMKELEKIIEELKRIIDAEGGAAPEVFSQRPDWRAMTIRELWPAYGKILDAFGAFVDTMAKGADVSKAIRETALMMVAKAQRIVDQLTRANQLIDALAEALAATGFYVIFISTGMGIDDWMARVQAARSRPAFSRDISAYVAGCAIVFETVGEGTFNPIVTMLEQALA